MAVNVFLIIVAIVMSVLLLAGIVMVIITYSSPDDENTAYLPKAVVLFSLYLTCVNVLLLPFDVAESRDSGHLDMEVAWQFSIYLSAIVLVIVIPFAYFFYENDQDPNASTKGCLCIPKWNSQVCEGLKWSIGFLISFTLILVIMWIFLHFANLPVQHDTWSWEGTAGTQRLHADVPLDANQELSCTSRLSGRCQGKTVNIELEVTFGVFLLAMMSFLGWFLFVVFAGIGLVALPYDLFNEWKYRPKPINIKEYAEKKIKLGQRASLLKKAGNAIKNDELNAMARKPSRKERKEMYETFHRFETAVFLLKRDYAHLVTEYKLRGGNPFIYWLKLLLSIVGGSISLMWIIHICVFILPPNPSTDFLNNLFISLEIPGFPLFGVLAFAFYSFWLLLCTIKGNFRFGLRFAFCRVFPMAPNETLMNSFLANSWLSLISSLVVVQFCAIAFPVYARNTHIDLLFGFQIRYLKFFTYFFNNNIFIYILLCFNVLGIFWLFLCPKNKGEDIEKELEKIMESKTDYNTTELQNMSRV